MLFCSLNRIFVPSTLNTLNMMTWILVSLVSSWLGTLSVESIFSKMPEGELVKVEYTEHGTMAGYRYYALVERQEDGTVIVKAQREKYGEIIEKKVKAETLADLRAIIKEYKMYKYKEYYLPPFQVLDGYSWSFSAKFSNGESISSGGSNARPRGEGLGALHEYMISLVTAKE